METETDQNTSIADANPYMLPDSYLLQRRMGGLGGLGGTRPIANPFLVAPYLIDRLRIFAEEKGLIVNVPGWEIKALLLASAEHLGAGKKDRGRPTKRKVQAGLLGWIGVEGLDSVVLALVAQIDADDEERIDLGLKPRSDRYWATLQAKKTSAEGTDVFEQNRNKWQKRISAARMTFGMTKRKI
jgi:hypothetical protein